MILMLVSCLIVDVIFRYCFPKEILVLHLNDWSALNIGVSGSSVDGFAIVVSNFTTYEICFVEAGTACHA